MDRARRFAGVPLTGTSRGDTTRPRGTRHQNEHLGEDPQHDRITAADAPEAGGAGDGQRRADPGPLTAACFTAGCSYDWLLFD